ncbi:hypothetical protein ACROYT_G043917 [Oculina patagonica]
MKRLKIAAIFIFTVLYLCEQRCGALEIGQQNKNAKRDGSVQREDGSSVPTNVKRAAAAAAVAKEVGQKAVEQQFEIMEEQQEKAQEFIDQKLEVNVEPEKGWKTEDLLVPAGFHIDAEITGEDEEPEGETGEQPFVYPMGVGGILMNGCFGTNYQPGDPCYEARWKTTLCLNLIDGAAFIGVGFDLRGDYSPESRKMSIIQRDCSGRATYDDFDVPDTMNVHGVYDTSASMQTFYSREEYQKSLQQQAGVSGSIFGFYAGVKKAWGSSLLSGSQKYMAVYSIDIDRYEIYQDEVKPGGLNLNFLREFMDLPQSYLAPGAAIKFQDFILRWGTHYIKSGKFGGRLQIFKTMEASEVASKEAFSQVMELEYRNLFMSLNAKQEKSGESSEKRQSKTSSTSFTVEGGDQEIASLISDFNSPTIKTDIVQWLESIRPFPKPFKFTLATITDLLKFTAHALFPDEERDWGCEAQKHNLKPDPDTGEAYYEITINGTKTRKYCAYMNREELVTSIEKRRESLEKAIRVYMEEGPISVSEITLPAGSPGCQTDNFKYQQSAGKVSWKAMTEEGKVFIVIFDMNEDLTGTFNGARKITAQMEVYVKYFHGTWFTASSYDDFEVSTACRKGASGNDDLRICVLGMVLTYDPDSGFLSMTKDDWLISKETYPTLTMEESESDVLMAHVEWPESRVFDLDEVIGYLPCNVKWSNAMRFDPTSDAEGKCIQFTASSKGTVFVIFSAIPDDKDTWYYVQISPHGVGIFKSQKLIVSTVDPGAVGLGSDILYQTYFVCVKETSYRTVIEYGKSRGSAEDGDVYLTMIDEENPHLVRFYSFGNGEDPLEIVDAHIVPRSLMKANCKGDTSLDVVSNMCLQSCHELCDPDRGCRRTSSSKPLATDCNACRYVKNAQTGECLQQCPEDWEQKDKECYPKAEPVITNCYDNPIGVADVAKIPDAKMSASSQYGSNYQAAYGRLNGDRGDGWCAGSKSSNNEWLQVDLGKSYTVCGVATQGDRNGNEWVTGFKLYFAESTNSWNVYQGGTSQDVVFKRRGNNNQIDQHKLKVPVTARYVRFNPVARYNYNCLRVEVYGTISGASACLENPCQNGGTCVDVGEGKYKCECPGVYGGDNCEKECEKTEDNQCCHFPYLYKGKEFNVCAMTAEGDRPWCSLTYDYEKDQQWGYCKDCSVRIHGGNHCCHLPFIFNGELQTSCLKTPRPKGDFSRHASWCSMYYDFDKKPIWKYCIE